MLHAMSLIGVTTHFVFSTIARADYQTDLSAFEQGDFATAERIFSDLAQQGDPHALSAYSTSSASLVRVRVKRRRQVVGILRVLSFSQTSG